MQKTLSFLALCLMLAGCEMPTAKPCSADPHTGDVPPALMPATTVAVAVASGPSMTPNDACMAAMDSLAAAAERLGCPDPAGWEGCSATCGVPGGSALCTVPMRDVHACVAARSAATSCDDLRPASCFFTVAPE